MTEFHSARWNEPFLLEMGTPGERGYFPPEVEPDLVADVGPGADLLPTALRRQDAPRLPELSQPTVLRHFLRLSQMTMGAHITPDASLGTCTMKYSPLVNEQFCREPEMSELHPLQDDDTVQGILEITYRFAEMLCEISGMDAFTFQPAAALRRSSRTRASSARITLRAGSWSSGGRSSLRRSRTPSIAPHRRWLASG